MIFVAIALGGCAVDLWTKSLAFARLGMPGGEVHWLVEGFWGFRTTLNQGALFGIGQGWVFGFAALSVAAGIFVIYWLFIKKAARDGLLNFALACVMAGILGNLYDRIGLHGLHWPGTELPVYAVRDFIHFQFGSYEWPTFNIADSLLVCGAALLVLHAFITGPQPEAADAS